MLLEYTRIARATESIDVAYDCCLTKILEESGNLKAQPILHTAFSSSVFCKSNIFYMCFALFTRFERVLLRMFVAKTSAVGTNRWRTRCTIITTQDKIMQRCEEILIICYLCFVIDNNI